MNDVVNKLLSAGDKFMSEMYLKQPGFTQSTCEPFTKNRERIQKSEETEDANYSYRNELGKASFQHDMACGDFKGLAGKTASDKVLRDKAFNIARNPKYDGYERGLASMGFFFHKKSSSLTDKSAGSGGVNNVIKQNEQLVEELQKSIIKKFLRKKSLFFI